MPKFTVGVEVERTTYGDIVVCVEAPTIEEARTKAHDHVESLSSEEKRKLYNKVDEWEELIDDCSYELTGQPSQHDDYYAKDYPPDLDLTK